LVVRSDDRLLVGIVPSRELGREEVEVGLTADFLVAGRAE
jgi:hypothetical protein